MEASVTKGCVSYFIFSEFPAASDHGDQRNPCLKLYRIPTIITNVLMFTVKHCTTSGEGPIDL